ncbi:pali-domain-containing protein [Russula emetica]|nr:pali-domain-containing protein [Russula emetica]
MKPATPGFIVTLIATILLAIVSFSVPWFKSVFFLKASLAVEGINGSVTFGVLGYCYQLNNGTTCSKASVGYQLDIDQLVGNKTNIQIPQVVVKWITYALVLHIVALVLAAISSFFGLLAHVREFSMSGFSSCISGLGAAIALLAFIFDLVFFFLVKSRINDVKGGSATMGSAIWLTFAAWVLLFFSGCFYSLGRCCIRRRPRDMARGDGGTWAPAQSTSSTYEEQMRLDAVKAEADRKARQGKNELGLPAFPEYDPTQPLTSDAEHENAARVPYRDTQYAAAPVGTRAVDDYYTAGNNAYPPRRQPTASSGRTQQTGYVRSQQTSGYAPSNYSSPTAVPAVPTGYQREQLPSQASTGYGHEQYASTAYNAPHTRAATNGDSVDPFRGYTTPQAQAPFNPNAYDATARFASPPPSTQSQPYSSAAPEPTSSYYTPQVQTTSPPSQYRSYTLGGSGYGDNAIPAPALLDPRASANSGYLPYPGEVNTISSGSVYSGVDGLTSPRRGQSLTVGRLPSPEPYEDSPPTYDEGFSTGTSHPNVGVSGKR